MPVIHKSRNETDMLFVRHDAKSLLPLHLLPLHSKCSLTHNIKWWTKHPERFVSISTCLRWGKNMRDVVYSHFYVDLLLLKLLLQIGMGLWRSFRQRNFLLHHKKPWQLITLCHVKTAYLVHVETWLSSSSYPDSSLQFCMLLSMNKYMESFNIMNGMGLKRFSCCYKCHSDL